MNQPTLPGMPADPTIPDEPHIFEATVTRENYKVIAKESGKDPEEILLMLVAREEQGRSLRVRYLALNYHKHEPVAHRDGKPRWCNICGLTGDRQIPEDRLKKADRKLIVEEPTDDVRTRRNPHKVEAEIDGSE